MKENILITGACGFVGAHLVKRVLEDGDNVIGLSTKDYRPVSTLSLLGLRDKITMVYGDVCDTELIRRVLTEYYIDRVYHLAAQAIVGVALKDPYLTYKVNVLGTASLLEACRNVGKLKSIQITSTDKIYGEGLDRKETDMLNAKGIYETSKICMDYVGRSFYNVYQLPIITTRACNIYGEYDLNRRIIPNTVRALKSNQSPIIFKNDNSIREYIYVGDVCDAYVYLGKNADKTVGEVFNIGSGCSATQEEVVRKLIEISGKNITPTYVDKPKDLFEIFQQTITSEKIKKIGWAPKFNLDRGLKRTWEKWV